MDAAHASSCSLTHVDSRLLQMSKLLLLLAPAACVGLGLGAAMPTVRLSNGVEMPLLLFGTPSCGRPVHRAKSASRSLRRALITLG